MHMAFISNLIKKSFLSLGEFSDFQRKPYSVHLIFQERNFLRFGLQNSKCENCIFMSLNCKGENVMKIELISWTFWNYFDL